MSISTRALKLTLALITLAAVSAAAVSIPWDGVFTAIGSAQERSDSGSPGMTFGTGGPGVCEGLGNIEVNATAGTLAAGYTELNLAFTAINSGVHQGAITIDVCGNTTEMASAVLNTGATLPAAYTSVTIRPVGGARVIEGTIASAVIKLFGADNVTIDGRIGGTGTNRDLTVRNNSTAAGTAAIWLASVAAGNGASNNTIRNLEIAAGVTQNTSTSATYGIIMCGTTISTTASGVDNDNNSFIANRIIKARYGIVTRGTSGATPDLNLNPVVTDNIVGPGSFGPDEIGKVGIFMQADTGATVSRNIVQFVGGEFANTSGGADRVGIGIGQESWSTAPSALTSNTYTVTRNIIHDVVEERTFSSVGLLLGSTSGGAIPTSNVVANNFIYNVKANGTAGDQTVGLGISGGVGDKVVFNSISLAGDVDPNPSASATSNYGSGIRIGVASGAAHGNLTLMNNSVYLDLSSSSTAAVRYYAISGPSSAYDFGMGGENYNNYYINPMNTQVQTGGLGTSSGNTLTTQFATLANWQTAYTIAQDANSIQANPSYFSVTGDLHVPTNSPNVNAGTGIMGIADDIDGDTRPAGPAVDIGADESLPSPGSLQFSSASYSATEVSGTVTVTVTRSGGFNGMTSVDFATSNGTATGGMACGAGIDYISTSGTLNWGDLDSASKTFTVTLCSDGAAEADETINVTLSNATGGATVGTPGAAVVTVLNSTIFGGTASVGTGETITSFTNPGGLFNQINNGALTTNLTVNVTSDLTAETGAVALNSINGGFTLRIQPAGGSARLISGGSATVLLDFSGADGVTIDGLNTGGNSLTIRNTTAGSGTAVRFINDASDNSIVNSTLEGGGTSSVLYISSGAMTGNDNITIANNIIRDRTDAVSVPFNVINLIGTSVAVSNSNILINNNQLINFTQAGIVIGTSDNVTFTNNNIFQTAARTTANIGVAVNSAAGTNLFSQNQVHDLTTSVAATGLQFNDARDTTVSRNRVYNFPSTSGSTGTQTGIVFNGSSGNSASVTIINNMVSLVPAFTNAQVLRGIYDFAFAGNTFNSYYNTVLIGGTGSGTSSSWACVRGTSAPTAYTITDNICFNNRTGGTGSHFAAGDQSNGTGTFTSNYNIFVGTGATAANFFDKGTASGGTPVDFATWQGGTRDLNSLASNPGGNYTVANMFASASDLHLSNEAMNPASNAGTPIMGAVTDFDGDMRSATTPEIGADEFAAANTPPTITPAVGVNRQEGSPASNGALATVTDTESGNGAVVVTVTSANPSNGVTISNIVNTNGVVTADIAAACGATNATFTLQASDGSLTSTTMLGVTVNPNSAPTLTYANAAVSTGGSTTVNPATGPGDNGSISTIVVQSAGTYTGTVSVDNTTGVVSFSNAGPVGMHTITIRATDNCGATTDATFTLDVQTIAGPVTVTATAGTTGPTPYNTLKEAFDAINAGTHQGAITVSINQNTAETASAILNASGGTSSYTTVLIRPTAVVTVSGSFAGAIIKLNGADNVTIDGRIGGTGNNRDLSVINNSAVTATAAIWLSSLGAGAGATNNTVRNLELACGVTQNTASLSTFGIIMSGATVSITSNGDDNDNNSFVANRIIKARYGIVTRGNPTNLNLNPIVTDNIIGPNAHGTEQIGKTGIYMQADSGAVVSRNTVQFVGGPFASTSSGADRIGIALGVESWGSAPTTLAGSGYTVTRNNIHDVVEERTFSAVGILVGTVNGTNPTDNLIANNFVSNVIANGTVGDAAIGIGIAGGNGDRVVFNSVRMAGDMDPNPSAATPTQVPANLRIANTPTNLTVKNNSLYNDMFSSSAAALNTVNIQVPSATFSFGTGALNNNNYYFPPSNTVARTGALGTTSLPTTFFATLANWQAALTPPQDANSIQADPLYVSAADLHLAMGSPNINAGATGTGVVNDIDFQVRDMTPDIGADEFNGGVAPANDIAAVSIITPAAGSVLINGTSTTPQARFYNAGSATQTNVMVQFTIAGPGGYAYSNTQSIASIGSDETVTVTFAAAPAFTTAGSYTTTATVLTADSDPTNNVTMSSFTVIDPLNGTYTVGMGGNFTSLTNPGGLFDVLNTAGASGNIVADITSDLSGETGVIPLNQITGGFGLTIKPSGAARTISGTAASLSLIKLNGADNVTIDGSLSGGTDRSLTILYTNTGGTVIWIAAQTGNGSNNNTVKNCIIASNPGTVSVAGILGGSGTTLGGPAEAPNNNNSILNNQIFRVQNSLYNQGNTGLDQNWNISNNRFGSDVVADKNSFRGMLIGNAQNFTVSNNVVGGVSSTPTTGAAMTGIQLAFTVNNGTVTNNRISDIRNNSGTGTGAFGMQLSSAAVVNVTIANNFISDAISLGSATIVNNGHGININGAVPAGGYKIYHNTINMNTNQTSGTTSALNVTSAVVAAGALDVRNNILANTQTAGATRYAVYSAAAASVFGSINFNDYFSSQNVGFIGGSARATLTDWKAATGQDADSKAVDPLFVSASDFHIVPSSPVRNMGTTGLGIATDIDGETRDAIPDMGADEVFGAIPGILQLSSATYSVGEAGASVVITVTRNGGSDGTVGVSYATSNGTATGGPSCAAGVDYVNTSGMLSFAMGETSKTFSIPICDDAADEPDETVNIALSSPTGGATIGTPGTAVLTIVDDDVVTGTFSVNNVRLYEGNAGTVNAMFTVTYSGSTAPASVQYSTANGTAEAGVDYVMTSGTLNFGPGTSLPVNVVINGDLNKEANETFFLNLSNPVNATITDGQGYGIIIDEDHSYVSDFDRDVMADVSVYRPAEGRWYILQTTNDTPRVVDFGTATDRPVPGDYDGDGKTDLAYWRDSIGQWTIMFSGNSTIIPVNFGLSGDKPVQGDYDGDGKTDIAVFRPSTGIWWVLRSSDGSAYATHFGVITDRPVQGDYDGDAKTDFAVYRDGTWYINQSRNGQTIVANFGLAGDRPVSGDFDGDGKYDLAIFRNGDWWIFNSLTATLTSLPWGLPGDIPAPADYDQDGTTDITVFRPANGDWYILKSSTFTLVQLHWGLAGDIPIASNYLPQ